MGTVKEYILTFWTFQLHKKFYFWSLIFNIGGLSTRQSWCHDKREAKKKFRAKNLENAEFFSRRFGILNLSNFSLFLFFCPWKVAIAIIFHRNRINNYESRRSSSIINLCHYIIFSTWSLLKFIMLAKHKLFFHVCVLKQLFKERFESSLLLKIEPRDLDKSPRISTRP